MPISNRCRQDGFTLVELLVTAMILVILTSFALPSYRGFVAKSVRTQAKSALMRVADRQEQFFLDSKQFTDDLTLLGFSASPFAIDRDGFEVELESADAVYQVRLSEITNFSYTLSAVPVGAQAANDEICGTLTLTEAGQRAHSGSGTDCW